MRLIAEAATTHGGDIGRAKEMVWAAKKAGADTVKFQHVDPEHFKDGPHYGWYKRVRFSVDEWKVVKAECEKADIRFLCTPQTIQDFEDLLEVGIDEVKVSSDNSMNFPLLSRIGSIKIKVIVSLDTLYGKGKNILTVLRARGLPLRAIRVLHCVSEYPCVADNVHIKWASEVDGFSDHTIGSVAAIMAVALGARVIEKHFMLDGSEGPDVGPWACAPPELKAYFDDIKIAERMMG